MRNVRTWDAALGGFYGQTFTDATTVMAVTIPLGTRSILVNVSGDFRMQLAPPLAWCAKTVNNELAFTDYTDEATDKSASNSVDLSSLDTAANGDYLYCASIYPFGGIYVDVTTTNSSGGGTLTGYTWAGGSWVLTTIVDGTNATQTMAQDGVITWTPPSSWKPALLKDMFPYATEAVLSYLPQESLYVIRFQTSAALDSTVTLAEIAPVTCATASTFYPYGYFQADTDYTFNINRDESGSLAEYSAGSKTVMVTFCKYGLREKA